MQTSLREFLSTVRCATPYQDPLFCGGGGFGGGVSEHHFVVTNGTQVNFYAFCTTNFAMSRHFHSLRNAYVYRGPVAGNEESFCQGMELLRTWAAEQGFLNIFASPQLPAENTMWLDGLTKKTDWRIEPSPGPKGTLILNLEPPTESLLASLKKSTRYEIRRAERLGIAVRPAQTTDDAETFFAIYRHRGQLKNFGTVGRQTFLHLIRKIYEHPGRGALLLSERDNECLGGVLVLRAGKRAHYVYGASMPDKGNVPVLYPALWRAICWAREGAAEEFDFGGYGPLGDPVLNRFKEGFGGKPVQFVSAFRASTSWASPLVGAVAAMRRVVGIS